MCGACLGRMLDFASMESTTVVWDMSQNMSYTEALQTVELSEEDELSDMMEIPQSNSPHVENTLRYVMLAGTTLPEE